MKTSIIYGRYTHLIHLDMVPFAICTPSHTEGFELGKVQFNTVNPNLDTQGAYKNDREFFQYGGIKDFQNQASKIPVINKEKNKKEGQSQKDSKYFIKLV